MRSNRLDMLDAMPRIFAAVRTLTFFIRIQCQPHRTVADGVSKYLKSATVQFSHSLLINSRIPSQRPLCGGIVGVRADHRRGVAFDYAIKKHLHGACGQPIVVRLVVRSQLLNALQLFARQSAGREIRADVKAHCELTALLEFVVEVEVKMVAHRGGVIAAAHHLRQAGAIGYRHAFAYCG